MSKRGKAVVLGGSVGGCCAARVLAEVCEEVVVLERDPAPDATTPTDNRAGVPQGKHLHIIAPKGMEALESLFPDLGDTIAKHGGERFHWGRDTAFYMSGFGWMPRLDSLGTSFLASRPLIEHGVRESCGRIENVRFVHNADITGLVIEDGVVRGARYKVEGQPGEMSCEGGLVVDAMGKHSKALGWLAETGIEAPETETVDTMSGYSTQIFKAPPRSERPAEWWWKFLRLDYRLGDEKMAGVLMEIENGHWLVVLAGMAKRYPPTDSAGFMRTVEELRSPILAEMLKTATPVTKVVGSRSTENAIVHFTRWPQAPKGFIAIGDSCCRTNPAHGLGITVVAWTATQMQELLKKTAFDSPEFPRAYFRTQGSVLTKIWQYATMMDMQRPETVGKRPPGMNMVKWYVDRYAALAHSDRPELTATLLGQGLHLESPAKLFSLSAIGQVMATFFTGLPKPNHGPYPPAGA